METSTSALETVANSIPGALIINYGFTFADATLCRAKQPICFCIIMQEKEAENCIKIPYSKLACWSAMTRTFGPIPLAVILFNKNKVLAKRLSHSWQEEYQAEIPNDVNIPKTGFKSLK